MSKRKQKPILSDKIAELIAPRRLLDPEIDSEDETAARAIDYEIDEDFDETEPAAKLSDIRRKNVKLLHDVDEKYRGKISSRKEMEMDSDQDESEEDQIEEEKDSNDDESEEISTEKSIGEFSMILTPKQRIKMAQQDDGSEEENEIGSGASSDDDDDIKSFAMKLQNTKVVENEAVSESDEDMPTTGQDELEKWDDDYEGEEIDEEESENEDDGDGDEDDGDEDNDEQEDYDDDEEGSDGEESDFDGGDIIPNATKETEQKPDLSRILPKQQTDDHLSKGYCVQNQLQIWEKLLEVRIHSQKMLIKANSLPQPTQFEQLTEKSTEFSELINDTQEKVSTLVSQMRDLQSLLLNQYSETKELARKRKPIKIESINDSEVKRSRLAQELDKDYSDFKG